MRESLSFHNVSLTEVLVIEGSYVPFSLVVYSDFLVQYHRKNTVSDSTVPNFNELQVLIPGFLAELFHIVNNAMFSMSCSN